MRVNSTRTGRGAYLFTLKLSAAGFGRVRLVALGPEASSGSVAPRRWHIAIWKAGPVGDTPSLSVIIPIYNTERYLRECLESVLAQTLRGIEVVCVNDGSTDSSLSIMREYEARDPRVRVVDKPNGGYGHSVNRGLCEARGEYVAVVEPDDFIDAHMYEDLMAAACLADGTAADVVKSAYWNYYDVEGEPPHIEAPNLMNCMPAEQFQFTAHTHWEVLYHHPSIWSAIYRRAFLEERGIRMIEPKGAGWADNPFFFETLLQARSIVWVPAAYYYYRQTNPDSSSNLKDFHLPFDRLRDIRALFDRLDERDPHVLICLYNRVFSYVNSVIGEFGFPESDPEIMGRIREEFAAIDQDVLYSAKRGIQRERLAYYEDVMGITRSRVPEHEPVEHPSVSIIVPMKDARPLLWDTFKSVMAQDLESFEVVCVDCASTDRSYAVACDAASSDGRFRVVSCDSGGIAQGCNAGIDAARGEFVYVLLPGMEMPEGFLASIVLALDEHPEASCSVFAKSPRFMGDFLPKGSRCAAMNSEGNLCALMLADGGVLGASSKLFRKAFLDEQGIRFDARETEEGLLFSLKALRGADAVLVQRKTRIDDERLHLQERGRKDAGERFAARMDMLDALEAYVSAIGDEEAVRAFRCCAVSQLDRDVHLYCSTADGEEVFQCVLEALKGRFGLAQQGGMYFLNQGAYRHLQRAALMGYQQFVQRELMLASNNVIELRNRNRSIKDSGSYRFGRAVSKMARKMLPKSVIAKVKKG